MLHGVTLQATPGHIWIGEASPALTPSTSGADTLRDSINNTHTYVLYVLHGKYTNADRHSLLLQRTYGLMQVPCESVFRCTQKD